VPGKGTPCNLREAWQDKPVRAVAAAIVVFLAAGAVLLLELLAVRVMAPYVGVSLNTYTGIIGIVLAAAAG
jgi:hypothetical protein